MCTSCSPKIPLPRMVALAIAALVASGCSREELNQLATRAKEKAATSFDQLEMSVPILPKTGEISLTLDAPTLARNANATLVLLEPNRPSVLQIRSYANPTQETYPAIFFQGSVAADSMSGLVGKTILGKLFVQPTADGTIWFSDDSSPISLTIQSLEDTELVGSFGPGSLTDAAGTTSPLSGTVRAVTENVVFSHSRVTMLTPSTHAGDRQ